MRASIEKVQLFNIIEKLFADTLIIGNDIRLVLMPLITMLSI